VDPTAIFSSIGLYGAILFVAWKLATRLIGVWKETASAGNALELKRLDQQHVERTKLSDAVECLSDRVHENTTANVEQLGAIRELLAETRETNRHMERLIETSAPTGRVTRVG
jgi:hypothetical protein